MDKSNAEKKKKTRSSIGQIKMTVQYNSSNMQPNRQGILKRKKKSIYPNTAKGLFPLKIGKSKKKTAGQDKQQKFSVASLNQTVG